ncbi:MAG: GtrA family protein [Nocardioidaceae bacterium]
MPDPLSSSSHAPQRSRSADLVAKVGRYAAGSVVATVCSELAFVLMYGPLHASPVWSTCVGWLAGAVPNYWLNRNWTWRQQGRPSLRKEVAPYVAIVAITLLLAAVATKGADAWLDGTGVSSAAKVVLVAGAFLGVYVAMFLVRFFLLDRLFARIEGTSEVEVGSRSQMR